MSHVFVSYGVIVGATPRPETEFTSLQELNEDVIRSLPEDPDWPWLDKSIFALPGPPPRGTFRRQIIHFGLSMTSF